MWLGSKKVDTGLDHQVSFYHHFTYPVPEFGVACQPNLRIYMHRHTEKGLESNPAPSYCDVLSHCSTRASGTSFQTQTPVQLKLQSFRSLLMFTNSLSPERLPGNQKGLQEVTGPSQDLVPAHGLS